MNSPPSGHQLSVVSFGIICQCREDSSPALLPGPTWVRPIIYFVLEILLAQLTKAKPINSLECSSSKEQKVKRYNLTQGLALRAEPPRCRMLMKLCVFLRK